MARLSFTIRKDVEGGSALQQVHPTHVALGDSDMALRADDFIYAVQPLGGLDSWLEVVAVDYGVMRLSWEIGVELDVPILGQTLTELRIVYSDEGTPRAVSDGQTITRITKDNWVEEHLHLITDSVYTDMPFAYYSMFGRYTDGASVWYERVASVSELVVRDEGSHEQMWRRIPLHYRIMDERVAMELDLVEGPMQQFLGAFGFEADAHRTLIRSLWRVNDPDYTHEMALNALAHQVGLFVDVGDIPSKFIRNVLANYGFLRERKGTLVGIMGYLNALTECRVLVLRRNVAVGETTAQVYRFMLEAQRANLIVTPRFAFGPNVTEPSWDWTADGADVTLDTATRTFTNESAEPRRITLRQLDTVIFKPGIPYYGSVVLLAGSRPVTTDYAPVMDLSTTDPSLVVTSAAAVSDAAIDTQSAEVSYIFTSDDDAPLHVYPYLAVTIPAGGTLTLDRWLLQPYRPGSYFDGDSELGGFINDNQGNIAKDYRWTANRGQSISVYTEYLAHKRAAVMKSIDFLMPGLFSQTGDNRFEFQFNVLPGETEQLAIDGTWDTVAGGWPPPTPPEITALTQPTLPVSEPVIGDAFVAEPPLWSDELDSDAEYRWVVEGVGVLPNTNSLSFTPTYDLKGKRIRIEARRPGSIYWVRSEWSQLVRTDGHIYPLTYPRTYNL